MSVSQEELLAFIDGELAADAAARIEAAIADDPALRAEVKRQRELARHMHGSFAPVMRAEIPGRLLEAVHRSPVSWRFRLKTFRQSRRRWNFLFGSILPAAAALACGLLVGIAIERQVLESAPVVTGEHGLVAHGVLAEALEHQLASEQRGSEPVSIGVSYRAGDGHYGHYCRSFTAGTSAGLACRYPDAWRVAALATVQPELRSPYAPAGSVMPPSIRAAIKSTIAGNALGPAAERRARDAGWLARPAP